VGIERHDALQPAHQRRCVVLLEHVATLVEERCDGQVGGGLRGVQQIDEAMPRRQPRLAAAGSASARAEQQRGSQRERDPSRHTRSIASGTSAGSGGRPASPTPQRQAG
jgi:hypothetical protein